MENKGAGYCQRDVENFTFRMEGRKEVIFVFIDEFTEFFPFELSSLR